VIATTLLDERRGEAGNGHVRREAAETLILPLREANVSIKHSTGAVRRMAPGDMAAVRRLVEQVYVGEGFSTAEGIARTLGVVEAAVAGPGWPVECLVVGEEEPRGFVIYLHGPSPLSQVARECEGEFRLLAVDPASRGRGAGETLVRACLLLARADGHERLVLSTQETMLAAHRLYERLGFARAVERDWQRSSGRQMLVYGLAFGLP
jgi:ribosomal protein S18 acetylase RimI-like enzyme